MTDIKERLDHLKKLIQTEDYLYGRGLSNEVNIRMFCYDPADEPVVCAFLRQLRSDTALACDLKEFNLYDLFLKICETKHILDKIPQMEEKRGSEFLLKQLRNIANEKSFIDLIRSQCGRHNPGRDVLLLTGIGAVYPFLRVHQLLEALQPHFSDIPILVLYPGKYDGHYMQLFNLLPPNDYYRAFNLV